VNARGLARSHGDELRDRGEPITLASYDARLSHAAHALGLALLE
jgi:hypothetical protein